MGADNFMRHRSARVCFGNVGAEVSLSDICRWRQDPLSTSMEAHRAPVYRAQIVDGGQCRITKTGDAELALFMNSTYGGVSISMKATSPSGRHWPSLECGRTMLSDARHCAGHRAQVSAER